jgi:hypothetical protein
MQPLRHMLRLEGSPVDRDEVVGALGPRGEDYVAYSFLILPRGRGG